jgi:hypothetical protein
MDSAVSNQNTITEAQVRTLVLKLIESGAHLTTGTNSTLALTYRGVPFGLDANKQFQTKEQVVDSIISTIVGRDFGSVRLAS